MELDLTFPEISYILSADSTVEEPIHLDCLQTRLTSGTYRLEFFSGVEYYDTFVID